MSSYPPPPPPYNPYDPYSVKAQRRAIKAQARIQQAQLKMQRAQLRMQRRSLRRNSVVGPIILLAVGVVFLLAQMGRLSWAQSLQWYGRWWPAVLVIAGVLLLLEWLIDQRRPDAAGHVRILGGGVIFLLIVLAVAGVSARGIEYGMDWHDRNLGNGYTNFDHIFGDRHDSDCSMDSAIANGATLVIRNPHGDVTITGDSTDGQVHVSEHSQTYAWKDSEATEKAKDLMPTFTSQGTDLVMNIAAIEGGQSDLTIQVPHTAQLRIQADRGDVNVSDVQAPVTVSANHGDVDLSSIKGAVTVHVNDSDASLTLKDLTGQVQVEGHSGDIEISDVTGDLSLQGDFFGSTHLAHVNGAVHFETTRTHFSAARLDEDFSVDSDSLDASEVLGPVVLKTAEKNITLERVQGSVDVTNKNGSVNVTTTSPLGAVSIVNVKGSVDLGVPPNAGFVLNAQTRNGDMENDFGLSEQGESDLRKLQGNVHNGGPTVTISTTEGDVTVRSSSVPPIPPAPPKPPAPPAPPKAPRAPKPPPPPKPSGAEVTF
jgi:DUF4097 and DUF4098 domain-containing protein YvlB